MLFVGFAVFLHAHPLRPRAVRDRQQSRGGAVSGIDVRRTILGVFVASGVMCSIAAIVLTAYLASARSDTAIGLELPVITAVVLGGVNIFGGSGTLRRRARRRSWCSPSCRTRFGLAGMTPEEQQIVTGSVLVIDFLRSSACPARFAGCGAARL